MNDAAQVQAQHQQQVEELCAAAVRALTGNPDLHYRDKRLYRGRRPLAIRTPHLQTDHETDDFGSFRGAIDGVALRLTQSDGALHESLRPDDAIDGLIFEMLEQFRVQTQLPDYMAGMRANLKHRFEQWSRAFYNSGLTESGLGILLYTVAQISWSRLSGQPVMEETEDLIEATRAEVGPLLGTELAGLLRERTDQARYAVHALRIAAIVGGMVRDAIAEETTVKGDAEQADDGSRTFALFLTFEGEEGESFAQASSGHSKTLEEAEHAYRVYTTQYDREVGAASLVRPDQLKKLRETLDTLISEHRFNNQRLARQLIALLSAPRRDGWLFGEEEGRLDGRRLAQIVSSPAERRVFRQDRFRPKANTALSFLIDCSGSMKSVIEPLAMVIDIMIRALQAAAVPCEVLGFTTNTWSGGQPRKEWLATGRPRNPGRLNEACHLVFKDAQRSWRRARNDIAAMLKTDLFREGIDGEAVDWACMRLNKIEAERRILIVVSDGSPMDSATSLANDPHYLDNHLKDVVARHEQIGDVDICGLGVGLDLSPYYPHCLATDLSRPVDNQLFQEILHLISGRHRR